MKKIQTLGLALLLSMVAGVANASIVRSYTGIDGSGVVTFTDLGGQLQIEFDNTSDNNDLGGGYLNSSVITGLVFDILEDVTGVSVVSFRDGSSPTSNDLSGAYIVELDVSNNITPGNTKVDLSIMTTNGINGGIYNADAMGSNIDNAFPDIATLVLDITSPNPWSLSKIENDILRMQRVGDNDGSLKIPGVPVPAAVWLFGSGLLGLVGVARRRAT